jgi:hypothetical protein
MQTSACHIFMPPYRYRTQAATAKNRTSEIEMTIGVYTSSSS